MQNRIEIILSGSGGQGIVLAGKILAEAAMLDGKEVVNSQSYGPEARGGASKSEIIISNEPINDLTSKAANILLCLTEKALDKYLDKLGSGGTLIIDESIQKPEKNDIKILQLPIITTGCESMGNCLVLNIVALGAINQAIKLVKDKSLESSILKNVPKGYADLNQKAFRAGLELVK